MNAAIPNEILKTALDKVRRALILSKSPRIVTIRATVATTTLSARIRDGIFEVNLPGTVVWSEGEIGVSDQDLKGHVMRDGYTHVKADPTFVCYGWIRNQPALTLAPRCHGQEYPTYGATPRIPLVGTEPISLDMSPVLETIRAASSWCRPLGDRALEWQTNIIVWSYFEGTTVIGLNGHRGIRTHTETPISDGTLGFVHPAFLAELFLKDAPQTIMRDDTQWVVQFDGARLWYRPVKQPRQFEVYERLFTYAPSTITAEFAGIAATDEASANVSAKEDVVVTLCQHKDGVMFGELGGPEWIPWSGALKPVAGKLEEWVSLDGRYLQTALEVISERPDEFRLLVGDPEDPVRFVSKNTRLLIMPRRPKEDPIGT